MPAAHLRTYREAANLTQEQVAEALDVSQQAVSQWERGETTPTLAKLEALAALLGRSIADLLNGEAA